MPPGAFGGVPSGVPGGVGVGVSVGVSDGEPSGLFPGNGLGVAPVGSGALSGGGSKSKQAQRVSVMIITKTTDEILNSFFFICF